jgi:hypothetical protein
MACKSCIKLGYPHGIRGCLYCAEEGMTFRIKWGKDKWERVYHLSDNNKPEVEKLEYKE